MYITLTILALIDARFIRRITGAFISVAVVLGFCPGLVMCKHVSIGVGRMAAWTSRDVALDFGFHGVQYATSDDRKAEEEDGERLRSKMDQFHESRLAFHCLVNE
jgi:hypothetical protein